MLFRNGLQGSLKLIYLAVPPRGADLNPMENMWAEVKRTLRDSWPEADPPRTRDDLWDLVSEAWQEVGEGERFVDQLTEATIYA